MANPLDTFLYPDLGSGDYALQTPPINPGASGMPAQTAPVAVPATTGGGAAPGGFDWKTLLQIAAPAALGVLAGVKGGAPGAGALLQGTLGGMDLAHQWGVQNRGLAIREREAKAEEEWRTFQRDSLQRQIEAAQARQQIQAQQQMFETYRDLMGMLHTFPPEKREGIIQTFQALASQLNLPADDLTAGLVAQIPQAEALRQQAAEKIWDQIKDRIKATAGSDTLEFWAQANWAVPADVPLFDERGQRIATMGGQEILDRLFGGRPPTFDRKGRPILVRGQTTKGGKTTFWGQFVDPETQQPVGKALGLGSKEDVSEPIGKRVIRQGPDGEDWYFDATTMAPLGPVQYPEQPLAPDDPAAKIRRLFK